MLHPIRSMLIGVALSCLGGAGAAFGQTAPVADAGEDQVVACESTEGAQVTLDGSASFDPDVGPNPAPDPNSPSGLTYTWSGDYLGEGVTLDGPIQVLDLPAGAFLFTLVVNDGEGDSLPDDVEVTVGDGSPPVVELSSDTATLWPPNHKYHAFAAGDYVASAMDACGAPIPPEDVTFTRVSSDEPDNSNGDGNTTEDILYSDGCRGVLLRSERRGPGDGRVYEASVGASDAAGQVGEAVLTVSVPKSQGKKGGAVDSGDAFVVDASPEACAIVDLCPPEPAPDCVVSQDKAALMIHERSSGDRLGLLVKGFDVAGDQLGEGETGVDYEVCLYVDDGIATTVESTASAPAGKGWKSSKRGQSYRARSRGGMGGGISRMALRSRGADTDLKAKAEGVDAPALPLAEGSTVIVQLHGSDGTCLDTTFDGEPKVNTEKRFKARR